VRTERGRGRSRTAGPRVATVIGLFGAFAAAPVHGAPDPGSGAAAPVIPADAIARQLADETASIDRALVSVTDKTTTAAELRGKRLRAAYRVLHAMPGDDAMAMARRRAAARLLLEREAGERTLLVDEAGQLHAARARIAGEAAQLPSIVVPRTLVRPAPGKVVRHFGTLAHERSKATLSRRGVDLDVEDGSSVSAPAAGTVRYAGPIRGLDQGVILDHGGYVTVLAKLGDVAVPIGAPVAAGDRIGRAAHHRIYLELRIMLGAGGFPIDPEPLLER
jgi:septal ring factor EnvC (AmiA/AmiB activator)